MSSTYNVCLIKLFVRQFLLINNYLETKFTYFSKLI